MSALSQFFGGGGGGTPQPNTIPVRGLVVTGGFGGTCSSNYCPPGCPLTPSYGTNINTIVEGGWGGLVAYYEEKITPGVTIPITVGAGGAPRACGYSFTGYPAAPGPQLTCTFFGGAGGSSCFGSCAYICVSSVLCAADIAPAPSQPCTLNTYQYCDLWWAVEYNSTLNQQYSIQNLLNSSKTTDNFGNYCYKAGSLGLALLPGTTSKNKRLSVKENINWCCNTIRSSWFYTRNTDLYQRHLTGGAMKGFSDPVASNPINHTYPNSPNSLCSPDLGPERAISNPCRTFGYGGVGGGLSPYVPSTSISEPSISNTSLSNHGYQSEITGGIGIYGGAGTGSGTYSCTASQYNCPGVLTIATITYPTLTPSTYPIHQCIGYGSGGPALSTPEGGGPAGGGTVIVQYPTAYAAATTSSPCVLNCSPNTPGCYTYKFICPGSITFP